MRAPAFPHADGLFEQAEHLVARDSGRPRQVSLRRAVSAAYYGVFHVLVRDASSFLVRGSRLRRLRSIVSRARDAISAWQRVRDTDEARVFLVGLFAADRMRG